MDNKKIKQDTEVLVKAVCIALKDDYNIKNASVNIRENYLYFDCYLAVISKSYYNLIFEHEFAKCLFGKCTRWLDIQNGEYIDTVDIEEKLIIEKEIREDCQCLWRTLEEHDGWSVNLQQMVLEKEPLDYINKFLSNKENVNDKKI